MVVLLLVIAGYVCGSVPFSYLIGRHYGIDVRRTGTRAASPGNVWRSVGKLAGGLSVAAEIAKGSVPMLLARRLTGDDLVVLLVGLAAMIGHNWPVFLRFDGGRGVSLGLITLLLVSFRWLGFALVPLSVLTLALRDSAPAILVTFLLVPVLGALLGLPQTVVVASLGIPAITVVRRVTAASNVAASRADRRRALVNRLVFDRDERDHEWPLGRLGLR